MKKISILLSLALLLIMSSCSDSKELMIDGKMVTVEPYGWADKDIRNDRVVYKPVVGNIVWSIIGVETVVAPVVLTGWYLYEPVSVKQQ